RYVVEALDAQAPCGPGPQQEAVFGPEDEPGTEWMELNMGPQHPSTHGVLRVRLKLDGERVRDADPDVGYLHAGFEKSFEDKTYTQGITFSDRMDYLAPPINNVDSVMAVEQLIGVAVPAPPQAIRVLLTGRA